MPMPASLNEMVTEAKRAIELIAVEEAATRQEQALVLDVREPGEFKKGRVPGAMLVPRGLLEIKADAEHPKREAALEDRDRPVITYCTGGSGARSALAAQTLKRMGFTNVACLDGGLDAWSAAGKPVESD
jgi:rhodanese-related sulfurtransferase